MATLEAGKVLDTKVIIGACKDAQQMVKEHYYKAWDDADREVTIMDSVGHAVTKSKLWKLYHDSAVILRNGAEITKDTICQHVAEIPATKHTITSFDAQPLQDDKHSMVSVHGTCKYGDAVCRSFHQQLVLWKDETSQPTRYWVMHDNMRWLGEEDL
eukprot:TRINITY_DN10443_c1_g1_i2.p1 TRINITY_DN10443_c1_g1~~TRINITY_DN10443_c1_g1_i2.p1  ORF type:complete len:175 (+),score=41.04 TRINITY_DN10443_c1_g1_i2:55-525(+)